MPEDSLKDKTVKGVGWSAIDNISSYAVTFVVGIILAQLLSPEDYGLC
jgi:O-antigen/teichoic acid export membrane protein